MNKNDKLHRSGINGVEMIDVTKRELNCLALIAKGYTMKGVALRLNISPRTVETHLRNLKEKFGFSSKNQLVSLWYDQYENSQQRDYV